jgi:hypothetical protein
MKRLNSIPTSRRPIRRRPPASRMRLEALEDRCLLSFSPAVTYPVGASPAAVLTGDFNGDGRPDLAVANSSSNTVSILRGNGNGTFQAAQNFATGAGPHSMAVGDFNKDGRLDLVTANSSDLSVLLGNGNGTFQAPHRFVLPDQATPNASSAQAPTAVVVGDLNNDGKLDLVVRGITSFSVFSGGDGYGTSYSPVNDIFVNVLLGNGVDSFSPKTTIKLVDSAESGGSLDYDAAASNLALGDFNGDGKLDVVVVARNVNVLLGNGDGTFHAPVGYVGGHSIVTGDLNGDGKLDLVVDDTVAIVLKGNGDGTFQVGQSQAVGSGRQQFVRALVLGDVNGDGKLDLTALTGVTRYASYGDYGSYGPTTTSYANVLLGHGDGPLGPPISATIESHAGADSYFIYYGRALADFNGDGHPDLAETNRDFNSVAVMLNGNDWTGPAFIDLGGFPSRPTAGMAGSIAATIRDNFGDISTGYRGTVRFSSTDPQAVLPAPYTFTAADGGTHNFIATLKTVGIQSITITDSTTAGILGTETGIIVDPAAAKTFTLRPFASSITAGVAQNFIITALDPYANIATGYGGVVVITSSDPQAVLSPIVPFPGGNSATGISGFSATFNTAGIQSLTATDATNATLTGTLGGISVRPAVKTLAVAGFPSPITAGVAGNITVTAKDAIGHVATWYTGTVVFSSSDIQSPLPVTYTFTTADAGVHIFSATLRTAGTQSMTVKDIATTGLSGSQSGIMVGPGAATELFVTGPASARSGKAFSICVKVRDAFGNIVTGYTGTIHFTSTDQTATIPANYTFKAADKGVHTFTGLVLRKRGNQRITIIDKLNGFLSGRVIVAVL